ncbi:hypothetical protein RHS02_03010, partial [Rhizoctonia solani]
MSRSHSVERETKPLPPVPQAQTQTEPAQVRTDESTSASPFANTLRQMVQDLPTTEYRSPLNIGGRINQGLAELTKEVVVPHAGRSAHHHDRYNDHHGEREDSHLAETIRPTQHGGEGDSFTSAEKIRRGWQERQDSSHQRSHSEEHSRSVNNTTSPPTAYRSGEGFPWFGGGNGQPGRQGSFRRHHRGASADTPPQGSEFYENSDESAHSSIRLEIHNATPIYASDSMKSRGRPSLSTRLRSSFQKARVGAARPARERTDLSRSPSPSGRRSPSPKAWRKPSPHSSIRATDQYSTPRTGGLPDQLPRIDSQKMDLGWDTPTEGGIQSPPRPPYDAIPTIPDLHTPGVYHESARTVPITEPDKPRLIEIHEKPPSHRMETSQSTDATVVSPAMQQDRHRRHRDDSGDHLVLRNFDGSYNAHGGPSEGPRRFKRLLSLTGRPVPIESDDGPPAQVSSSPTRPKLVSTPSALIRSTSLIRTRSRKKESSKHRERVEPDTHVGYGLYPNFSGTASLLTGSIESDPWGEGPEIHRDAQGNRIFPQEPKRKTSQKKPHAHTGPTKIALPMGQVEEFHSVHSNSPIEPQHLEPVSNDPKSQGEHKRTISTTTFHTAQSGNTRPGSPTRKMSSQSTHQVKASVPDTKYDGWRRSRAGAPRRPSQTLLASPPSNGNQYADEAPIMDDPPIFTTDPQEYDQESHGHGDTLSPPPHHQPAPKSALGRTPAPVASGTRSLSPVPAKPVPRSLSPAPVPAPVAPVPRSLSPIPPTPEMAHTSELRSQSPLPSETSVHIHIVHGPRIPSPAPPRAIATPTPDSPRQPVVSASPALASGPPPLIRMSPPRRNTPPPLISTPPPWIATPPPAISMPIPVPAPAPSPRVLPLKIERQLPSEPSEPPEPRPRSPQLPIRTPSPHRLPPHGSPDQTPPIQTPRAHTPNLEDHIQINPVDTLPGESHGYDDPRYRSHTNSHPYRGPEVRFPVPDTPTYVLPRRPTPTLTSPGVMVNDPSGPTSLIDRDPGPGPYSPARSVNIEYRERPPTSSMLSNRPMPRHIAGLSESEHQMRQQNRQTGSEMSFVNVEPLTKREKLAASVLSISSMPWLRNRTSSRSHDPHSYHFTHEEDPRYYDRHGQPTDYPTSATPPQLPPVDTGSSHTTRPRPDPSKELPAWYPREQMARNPTLPVPPERESRGPKIGQEAWGWRSSPHGIPEEAEETSPETKHHGPGVTSSSDTPKDDSTPTPPVLPPKPVVPHVPEPEVQPSGEKKRVPKYRIEQDERGHPVLVPEPGSDDSRWTVFEIGGVEFKRAPGDSARATHWMPKRLSGLRRSEVRTPAHKPEPIDHCYGTCSEDGLCEANTDPARINELLAQLQNSTAFQSFVTSNNPSSSSQTPSLPTDEVSVPAQARVSPPVPGSTVFDLLSRLNPGASSGSQPLWTNESIDKLPTSASEGPPTLDLKFMNVQQALPHISKLTQRVEVRDKLKKIQEVQNQLEQSLYASQQDVMRKHEQRVTFAKNKASIVGVSLSDKEIRDLDSQLAGDLKRFHTNQVLVSWDAQRIKQQTQLETLGVPCMFVTSDPSALQRQQKILRILLESLGESEDTQ